MTMISEIAEYLEDQSIGVVGSTIFYSQMPDPLPTGDFHICVYDRIGPKPSVDILDIKSPMFQILVRAKNYATGKAKLDAIRDALHGTMGTYLIPGGIYFRRIQANSEGGHIGVNEAGRDEFSINFMTEIIEP